MAGPTNGSRGSTGQDAEQDRSLRRTREGCYPLERQHDHHAPVLLIESASSCGADKLCRWLMSWRVQSVGREPIEVLSIWLPHDKFARDHQFFDSPIRLTPNESRLLEVRVAFNGAPGRVVDNAFFILRLLWMDHLSLDIAK